MKEILKRIFKKFSKRRWRVPDLSTSEKDQEKKSATIVENLIDFKNQEKAKTNKNINKQDMQQKKIKRRILPDTSALTIEERLTPTSKKRRLRKKSISKRNLSKSPQVERKILGPMGFTYIKGGSDLRDDEYQEKSPESKHVFSVLRKNKVNNYDPEPIKDINIFSKTYIVDDEKEEDLEIVVNNRTKWQSSKQGITIGRTVKVDMESEIEEEFHLKRSDDANEGDYNEDMKDQSSFSESFSQKDADSNELEIDVPENYEQDSMVEEQGEDEDYTEDIEIENISMDEDYTDDISDSDITNELESENENYEDDFSSEATFQSSSTDVSIVNQENIDEGDEHQLNKERNLYLNYELPPYSILDEIVMTTFDEDREREADLFTRQIEEVIAIMKLTLHISDRQIGSRVVKFQCPVDPKLHNFRQNDEIMKRVKAMIGNENIRFQFPLYGMSNTFGIEVPFIQSKSIIVQLKTALEHLENSEKAQKKIIFPLGLDVNGGYPVGDLSTLVHLLVAGYTGSGKSVFLQSVITTFLLRTNPYELKLVLIDPKQVEFTKYEEIPHLLMPIVTESNNAILALEKMIVKMENRYSRFKERKVKDISSYNKIVEKKHKMSYIVIIIDELADLIMSVQDNRLESAIVRLAQKARAAGIHLIVSTQRPSTEVVTGLIKSNLPTRIAFALATGTDSRIILDEGGAELLLGQGDMLCKPSGYNQVDRLQGVFTSEEEIDNVVEWVTNQAKPDFDEDFLNLQSSQSTISGIEGFEIKEKISRDHVIAVSLIINNYENKKTVSISSFQRMLGVGHSKAARIVDALTAKGVLTEDTGNNKPRDIIGSLQQLKAIKEEWQSKL